MFLAENLASLRNARKFSQREVSEALGMSVRSYIRYELGEREPSVTTLIALANYFDISLDALVGRERKPD